MLLLGERARRGAVLGAGWASLVLASAGCGDLFHSTGWATVCERGGALEGECASNGGSGSGASGSVGGSGGSAAAGGAPPASCSDGFGDANDQHLAGLALDGDGAALVVGRFAGTFPFGDRDLLSAGTDDAFVAKLGPSCDVVYAKSYGSTDGDEATANAVDAADNQYVVGAFHGSVDFGDGPVSAESIQDGFVLKLDPSGDLLWKETITATTVPVRARAVAVAPDGVVVAGDFDGGTAGDTDIFVVKFDENGADAWIASFGGAGADAAMGVTVDEDGNTWVSGNFTGSIVFGASTLISAGGNDAFVVQLDALGKPVQSARFGDALDQQANNIAAVAGGGVIIASTFAGAFDVGSTSLVSAGGDDVWVARLDAQAGVVWARAFGGPDADHGRSVAVSGGEIVVSGDFAGSAAFGDELTSAGDQDVFVLVLDGSGEPVASVGFGDEGSQSGYGAARDGAGQLVVGGDFAGQVDFGEGLLTSAGAGDLFVARTGTR